MEPGGKEIFIPEINAETLMAKIREGMERSRHNTASFASGHGIAAFNASVLRDMITAAAVQADAGAEVTPMLQIPAPFRKLALLVGKVVVTLSSFITVKQRNFNAIILHVLRGMVDSVERAIKGIISGHRQDMDELRQELEVFRQHHEETINQLMNEISGLKAMMIVQERRAATILEEASKCFPEQSDKKTDGKAGN